MFRRDKVEEVLERADIVAVISRYLQLERDGADFRGKCPFHPDASKSFVVSPATRSFQCTGCQISGDAIRFIQRYMGKNFADATRELGQSAGVELHAFDPHLRERMQIQRAIDFATEHYKACLADPQKGAKARQYLKERGIRDDMVKSFGLGWAMSTGNELALALEKANLLDAGIKARLIESGQPGNTDFFRGRIMIPIRTPEGRNLAFLGRLVEGEGKKYLRTFDSLIYREDATVLGLDVAKQEISRRKSAVLVEGGFDVIWMHQIGFQNTVSVFPSSVSAARIKRLKEAGAQELILMLDGDTHGRNAVDWNSGPLLVQGIPTRVVLLPEGEDPDTYAMKIGAEGMKKLIEGARPLMEHLLKEMPGGTAAPKEEQEKGLDRVLRISRHLPMGPARAEVLSKVSERMGVKVNDMEKTLLERMRTRAVIVRSERAARRLKNRTTPPADKGKGGEGRPASVVEQAPDKGKAVDVKATPPPPPPPPVLKGKETGTQTPPRKITTRKRPPGGSSE